MLRAADRKNAGPPPQFTRLKVVFGHENVCFYPISDAVVMIGIEVDFVPSSPIKSTFRRPTTPRPSGRGVASSVEVTDTTINELTACVSVVARPMARQKYPKMMRMFSK